MCPGNPLNLFTAVLTASWKDKQEVVICKRAVVLTPRMGLQSGPGWEPQVAGMGRLTPPNIWAASLACVIGLIWDIGHNLVNLKGPNFTESMGTVRELTIWLRQYLGGKIKD